LQACASAGTQNPSVRPPFSVVSCIASCAAIFVGLALGRPATASAGDAFDRLEAFWAGLHDYAVTIEEHEVMGDQTSEHEIRYLFKKPNHARLDVVQGTKSGSVVLWNGGDRVTAYRRNMAFFKIHGGVKDHDLTSLRGNSVLSPNMGDLLACFGEHRSAIREHDGPVIDGDPTDEVALPYTDVSCPDDSPSDKSITLDVLDVSKRSGLILMRKRYEGDAVVERWELKDYRLNAGIPDSDLR
jgi:outer membrane lipoprotein-sorting protein